MKKVAILLLGLMALVAIYDQNFADCGFDGAVLSWNIMEAPDAHIDCLR
ncbi:MAG: hypothetical protein J6P56_09000 [Bacteroidales bacterium]|nr:hypothetical protein [Bacteroidales bacterium]